MNLEKSVCIALAIVLTASVVPAAEAGWPKNSASDLSIFVTTMRFQIHADHCSATVPQLEPRFKSLMENLSSHIQELAKDVLADDAFRGMSDQTVPTEIIDAFEDSFDDVRHNVERLDTVSSCPKTLQTFGEIDDESLKSGLIQALTAVQNMIQKLEKQNARQASPGNPMQRSGPP
jgi:hypothetical protein